MVQVTVFNNTKVDLFHRCAFNKFHANFFTSALNVYFNVVVSVVHMLLFNVYLLKN